MLDGTDDAKHPLEHRRWWEALLSLRDAPRSIMIHQQGAFGVATSIAW